MSGNRGTPYGVRAQLYTGRAGALRPAGSPLQGVDDFRRFSICSNHHRGSYTSPALAAASYPFVDLPPRNTLRYKLFPSSKFYQSSYPKDIPGSHVVIKDNLNPTDEVKTDAAELAAYYSKARLSNLVQVDMIDVKKLNKPTAGKPGFVTYTGQKTLRVTPTEEKIDSMRMK